MEINFDDSAKLAGDLQAAARMKSVVMKINLTMKMSGYSDTVDITAPEDTTPLKGFLTKSAVPAPEWAASARNRRSPYTGPPPAIAADESSPPD